MLLFVQEKTFYLDLLRGIDRLSPVQAEEPWCQPTKPLPKFNFATLIRASVATILAIALNFKQLVGAPIQGMPAARGRPMQRKRTSDEFSLVENRF